VGNLNNDEHEHEVDKSTVRHSNRLTNMSSAYIGLGANLGDRRATLLQACVSLGSLGEVMAVSPVYETEPVGFADQPRYLNAAARLETDLQPDVLLRGLHGIENELGRVRTFPNAPRTIDLDLLLYDDAVIETSDLMVPHPRVHKRAFVLVPLHDIAPDFIHPQSKISIGALLERLGAITDIYPTSFSLNDLVQSPRSASE